MNPDYAEIDQLLLSATRASNRGLFYICGMIAGGVCFLLGCFGVGGLTPLVMGVVIGIVCDQCFKQAMKKVRGYTNEAKRLIEAFEPMWVVESCRTEEDGDIVINFVRRDANEPESTERID